MPARILMLPGDGVGPEIFRELAGIVDWFTSARGLDLQVSSGLAGTDALREHGAPISEATLAEALEADAVLLGAVGVPELDLVDFERRPGTSLLRLRQGLRAFANLRPVKVFEELLGASTLRPDVIKGVDLIIVRELLGGLYFAEPRGKERTPAGLRRGFNTLAYDEEEIRRVACVAFDLASSRRGRVCSVDKANVLATSEVWREVVQELREERYRHVELTHMYVDNAAMQLVRDPRQFDVILTDNMFGDILSDAAAMIAGSLGMLPSASIGHRAPGARTTGLYEPVHGSATDIAGKGICNPFATILSFGLLLEHSLELPREASLLERAVRRALATGIRTADIAEPGSRVVGTGEACAAVLAALGQDGAARSRMVA